MISIGRKQVRQSTNFKVEDHGAKVTLIALPSL